MTRPAGRGAADNHPSHVPIERSRPRRPPALPRIAPGLRRRLPRRPAGPHARDRALPHPAARTAPRCPTSPCACTTPRAPGATPRSTATPASGLPPLRAGWIRERGDVEEIAGRAGAARSTTATSRRPTASRPRARGGATRSSSSTGARARSCAPGPGTRVSQLAYARRGIVTPEMEFVAIRENAKLQRAADADGAHGRGPAQLALAPAPGPGPRRLDPARRSPRSSSATRSPGAARSYRPTSTTPSSSRW